MKGRKRTIDALTAAREHDWKIALPTGLIALVVYIIGRTYGSVRGPHAREFIIVWVAAVAFLIFGVIAVRRLASGLGELMMTREMPGAGSAIRLVALGVGYVVIFCAELSVLDVSIEHLLVGAGLAGIILGIAAQQSLGNVFASVVLLLARPFTVGDRIRIRSGILGAVNADVLGLSLTYVTIRIEDGVIKVPNSVMLASAVGLIESDQGDLPTN